MEENTLNILTQCFDAFCQASVPEYAHPMAVLDLKLAFFSGCYAAIVEQLLPNETVEIKTIKLKSMIVECEDFLSSVSAEQALIMADGPMN